MHSMHFIFVMVEQKNLAVFHVYGSYLQLSAPYLVNFKTE